MLLHSLTDAADGSNCTLRYEAQNRWLRATWRGFIDAAEARRGAVSYLANAGGLHCPYLLNDNAALQGPWFDSARWLETVWLPHALALGLRYVAHVVQADTHADILTLTLPPHLAGALELQIFDDAPTAEAWLRSCQHCPVPAAAAGPDGAGPNRTVAQL